MSQVKGADPHIEVIRVITPNPNADVIREELRLEALGYDQELKRDISMFETFGFAFSIMGVLPSIASTIWYSLPYGGPVSMIWGWLISGTFILFIGGAMADLASSMPTSGGLYFWTHRLAHPEIRDFLAWIVGYNSFLGNVAAVSSLAWATAGILFAAVSINDNTFSPTTGQTFALYIGVLIFIGCVCAYATKPLARCQTPSVILNVLLLLATVIGLPIAMRKELNSAKYTFTDFENLTGWTPGFAFILSFLSPVWTICSFDSAVSISEEARNAAIAVPWSIVGSIGSALVTGFACMIVLAWTMGSDISAVYNSDIGQPLAFIYEQAFGVRGSLVIWSFMCIAELMMTASLALPASRQAFAFARDGALPFSKYFYSVNKTTGTPVRTVWLVIGLAAPLGLLGFANDAAINAIFSLAIIGPYCAYAIPIACRVFARDDAFLPGPWYLGRFSRPVAIVALVWMAFAAVVFCFPADVGTTASTMNYACVVAAAVWTFAIGYWFVPGFGGKTFFKGPMTNLTELELNAERAPQVQADSDSLSKSGLEM